jgi:hypothetical protein
MKTREKSFFDGQNRLSELSRKGDFLGELNSKVKWKRFRKPLERAIRETNPKEPDGRPPNAMEYQIMGRLSFQRFLGLKVS